MDNNFGTTSQSKNNANQQNKNKKQGQYQQKSALKDNIDQQESNKNQIMIEKDDKQSSNIQTQNQNKINETKKDSSDSEDGKRTKQKTNLQQKEKKNWEDQLYDDEDDESAVEEEEELEIKQDRKVIILPSKNLKNQPSEKQKDENREIFDEEFDSDEDDVYMNEEDSKFDDDKNQMDSSSDASRVFTKQPELPPFDFQNLPNHSCIYCGIHDVKNVVQCKSKNCNKWFCNGKGHLISNQNQAGQNKEHTQYGSHIVWHMVKSNHKEVQVHDESPLKESTLECYICASKNMFLLGYISAKTEACIILLCREPCLNKISQEDSNFDTANWMPLIENKQLQTWLVSEPSQSDILRSRAITPQQISKLEDLWKQNPKAVFADLSNVPQEKLQQPVLLRYKDPKQYKDIFEPLIRLEADYDKQIKENQTQNNIKIKWDWSINKKKIAYFVFPNEDNVRLVPGDELKLKYEIDGQVKWKSRGHIVKITQNEEICLEVKNYKGAPQEPDCKFTVEFVWKSTSFDRMKQALKIFLKDETSLSNYIFYKILGYNTQDQYINANIPKQLSVQGLPELNHFQMNAVRKALTTPLTLIQGPPGTGKTVTSTTLVTHLVKQKMGKVLVCAPSNIAVDQLTDKINGTGLKVVRLCARSRESISSNVDYISLHVQIKHLKHGQFKKWQEILAQKEQEGELNEKDDKIYKDLKRKAEDEILRGADVICTTCVSAFDQRLKQIKFKQVLIDEATQATEPETLIPILKGAKHVILVGDHCQLGPVIMCKKASKAGLNQSLFERLICLGIRPIRLQVQYRMHPCLSNFPSLTFYEGSLQNGISKHDRILDGFKFPWPQHDKPMYFYHSVSNEEISASGTSFLNRKEAENVEQVVSSFFNAGLRPDQIGIITPYEGQRAFIMNFMQRQGQLDPQFYKEIEVASVDSFQGREKDFILFSCVRSNESSGIGFLNDPRRLNVALTRAKYGLIIFGNAKVLSKHDLWNNLLNEYKIQGTLVEGPSISQLKLCNIVLRRPVKYNPDKRDFVLTEKALNNFNQQQNQLTGQLNDMYLNKKENQIKETLDFDIASEISKTESQISYGNRCSKFGFTDMFGLGKSNQNKLQDKSKFQDGAKNSNQKNFKN